MVTLTRMVANMDWQIQEVKKRFSEMIRRATSGQESQYITRHGKRIAVVLSVDEYQKLKGRTQPLSEFLAQSPLDELDLQRDRDPGRDVVL